MPKLNFFLLIGLPFAETSNFILDLQPSSAARLPEDNRTKSFTAKKLEVRQLFYRETKKYIFCVCKVNCNSN